MIEIKKKFQKMEATKTKHKDSAKTAKSPKISPDSPTDTAEADKEAHMSSLDERLRAEFQLNASTAETPPKRKRSGLVTEVHIISVSISPNTKFKLIFGVI